MVLGSSSSDWWIALVSALAGALIGALAGGLASYVIQRSTTRRALRTRVVLELVPGIFQSISTVSEHEFELERTRLATRALFNATLPLSLALTELDAKRYGVLADAVSAAATAVSNRTHTEGCTEDDVNEGLARLVDILVALVGALGHPHYKVSSNDLPDVPEVMSKRQWWAPWKDPSS